MTDESGSLIPRPSREALAWRATGLSLAGSAAFLFAVGLAGYEPNAPSLLAGVVRAAIFAGSALVFFVAHESGHLAAARAHRVAASPPWFLPIGAVMRLREAPATRGALVEIGAWGPLSGVVALALLLAARLLLGGPLPPPDARLAVSGPALWWLLAGPLGVGPPSAADPLVGAFCLGSLVTALNLVPFGQLDGGHVAAGAWPSRAVAIGWIMTVALLAAGLWWPGYAAWAAVIHLVGTTSPLRARHEGAALPRRARASAIAALIAFLLTASAAPLWPR